MSPAQGKAFPKTPGLGSRSFGWICYHTVSVHVLGLLAARHGILAPGQESNSHTPWIEGRSNHWTTRKLLSFDFDSLLHENRQVIIMCLGFAVHAMCLRYSDFLYRWMLLISVTTPWEAGADRGYLSEGHTASKWQIHNLELWQLFPHTILLIVIVLLLKSEHLWF